MRDTKADGHSATISWVNHLRDADLQWHEYREGSCVNKLGAGTWAVCNKDFYEDGSMNYFEYYGSSIEFSACVYDSAAGTWHGCSGGYRLSNNE